MTKEEYLEYHEQWYTGKCIYCGREVYTTNPYSSPVCDSCHEEDFEDDEESDMQACEQ